jgi:hypothetical protein
MLWYGVKNREEGGVVNIFCGLEEIGKGRRQAVVRAVNEEAR